jgi:hypothetical protein
MTTRSPASSSDVAIDEKHGAPLEEVKPPMAGLSEQEREIIERQIDAPKLTVGYFALFRYASKNEFIIMVIAVIASIAAGAVMPLMTVCTISFLKRQHGWSSKHAVCIQRKFGLREVVEYRSSRNKSSASYQT